MSGGEYKERVAIAAVLAALATVPISLGPEIAVPALQLLCLGVGLVLWVAALSLICPPRRGAGLHRRLGASENQTPASLMPRPRGAPVPLAPPAGMGGAPGASAPPQIRR
jgi:hypothetical protein